MNKVEQSNLGHSTVYPETYEPKLLFPIERAINRKEINIGTELPFFGYDLWHAYEVSWLNQNNKPMVAILKTSFPAESPNLIESKSFKLYLNSLNNKIFAEKSDAYTLIHKDLSDACGAEVLVEILDIATTEIRLCNSPGGISIDELDIQCDPSAIHATDLLEQQDEIVSEVVYSNLMKSNCPVTNQPDWGTVIISYKGKKISHEGLLGYIVSYRHTNEFHEQCVERIFMDLLKHCKPESLTVSAHYTRRGGLDINPIRSTEPDPKLFSGRLVRQ